jgi:hydrogenase assembly chaperone HypC/HupF
MNQGEDMSECVNGHCLTCADVVLPARVLRVDEHSGLALVDRDGEQEEVDLSLVERVAPGDVLLVHGGVALARKEDDDEICR